MNFLFRGKCHCVVKCNIINIQESGNVEYIFCLQEIKRSIRTSYRAMFFKDKQ